MQRELTKPLEVFGFTFLFVYSVVLAWHPLVSTFRLATESSEYTHILLILPLYLAFLYTDRKWVQLPIKPSVRVGLVILSLAAVTAGLSNLLAAPMTADLQLSIAMLALVTWWIGSFVLCFGSKASRSILFPLCFLFWMVPLPRAALDPIINLLQAGSAVAARLLFASVGVPVAQSDTTLFIPGLTVEVARECSSIRSSTMLVVTSMVLAQLLLRSAWRKAFVIALALPLSIAKNSLRIFTLAMLGTRVDPDYLTGKLHRHGGIVFFAVALAAVFFVLWILRRAENNAVGADTAISIRITSS